MTTIENIHERLTTAFHSVVAPDVEVHPKLSAADVDEWNSLAQVNLIFAIEEEFGLEFSQTEMTGLANIGDLERLVVQRLGIAESSE